MKFRVGRGVQERGLDGERTISLVERSVVWPKEAALQS